MQLVTRAHVLRWMRALTLRTFGLFLAAVVASIVFVIIARELRAPALDHLDKRIELAVHELDSTPADLIAATATFVGSNYVIIPMVVFLIGLAAYRKQRVVAVVLEALRRTDTALFVAPPTAALLREGSRLDAALPQLAPDAALLAAELLTLDPRPLNLVGRFA